MRRRLRTIGELTNTPEARRGAITNGHWFQRLRSRMLLRHDPARQLGRFLVVGAGNTLISFAVYRLLLVFGTWYVIAAPLAFAVGAVNGYVFNRRWTFGARDSARARVLYLTITASGALSTSLIVLLFVRAVGTGRVGAYLVAIPPVTLGTFVANRLWTFAGRD
jgi:putative flippase GtrA